MTQQQYEETRLQVERMAAMARDLPMVEFFARIARQRMDPGARYRLEQLARTLAKFQEADQFRAVDAGRQVARG